MSLSFREQAAIALYATPATERQDPYDAYEAIGASQVLANACCEKWGHETEPMKVDGYGPARCNRCGKEIDQ